jgi:ABC-type multidrug transport system fused ATPase/permease subunit
MLQIFGASEFLMGQVDKLDFYLFLFLFLSGVNLVFNIVFQKSKASFYMVRILRFLVYFISIVLSVFLVLPFFVQKEYAMVIGFAMLIASLLPVLLILWDIYIHYLSSQVRLTIEKLTREVGENNEQTETVEMFTLRNKSDKEIFSKSFASILFFEANDNYTNIHFLSEDKEVKKYMERLSLKKIEELIDEYSKPFFRVHKSFIINPKYLEEIRGKSQAYKLKLANKDRTIPVSRNFDVDQLTQYIQ